MHRTSTMPSSLSDVLQLFSKFLSKVSAVTQSPNEKVCKTRN